MHAACSMHSARLKHTQGQVTTGSVYPLLTASGLTQALGLLGQRRMWHPASHSRLAMPVPPACDGQLSSRALVFYQPPNHPPWREYC